MPDRFKIVRVSTMKVDCLNPECGKPIEFEIKPAGEKVEWADIPEKVTLRCGACGVTGEYHPKNTRGGKALGWH